MATDVQIWHTACAWVNPHFTRGRHTVLPRRREVDANSLNGPKVTAAKKTSNACN